jgi:hypothetical protein
MSSVNHPKHYNSHPSGVECITIAEGFNFNIGNAIKYVWRAGLKGERDIEDLEKAVWYINREIERLKSETNDIFEQNVKAVRLGEIGIGDNTS